MQARSCYLIAGVFRLRPATINTKKQGYLLSSESFSCSISAAIFELNGKGTSKVARGVMRKPLSVHSMCRWRYRCLRCRSAHARGQVVFQPVFVLVQCYDLACRGRCNVWLLKIIRTYVHMHFCGTDNENQLGDWLTSDEHHSHEGATRAVGCGPSLAMMHKIKAWILHYKRAIMKRLRARTKQPGPIKPHYCTGTNRSKAVLWCQQKLDRADAPSRRLGLA